MIKRLYNKYKVLIALVLLVILVFSTIYFIDLNSFNSKLIKYDDTYMMKVTYLIGDKDKMSEDATIDDTVHNHIDDVIYSAAHYVPLTKDGDYLYVDLSKFTNKKLLNRVTDTMFAMNNLYGEPIEGCSYDKKTKTLKIPFSFYEKADKDNRIIVQAELETLLTYEEISKLETDYSVKKLVTFNNTASNDLMDLETKIPLSRFVNSNLSKDNIYIYINGSDERLNEESYGYDKLTDTLVINMPTILINKIDIKLGNNIIKNVFAINPADISKANSYRLLEEPTQLLYDADNGYGAYYTTDAMTLSWGRSTDNFFYCTDGTTGVYFRGEPLCVNYGSQGRSANADTFAYNKAIYWDYSDDAYHQASTNEVFPYMINTGFARRNGDGTLYMNFADPDEYILMQCIHPYESAAYDWQSGGNIIGKPESEGIKVRIQIQQDHRADKWLLLSVRTLTQSGNLGGWGGQAGVAYFKVYWEGANCNLNVNKTISAFNNDGGDATTTIGLYSDSSCSTLVSSQNATVNLTNGSTGTVTFNNLTQNTTYYVKETSFALGSENLLTNKYTYSSGCVPITATDSNSDGTCDSTPTLTNTQKSYCYSVKKADSETGSGLASAGFTLTGAAGDVHTGTTNASGITTFTGLKYQNYTLSETSAPSGYWNDNSAGTTVSASSLTEGSTCNNPVTKSDTKQYYCLKVKKTDSSTGNALTGAEFTATKGSITINKNSTDYSTSNGITSFFLGDSSAAGNWTVTETKAPDGYSTVTSSRALAAIQLKEYSNAAAARTACLSDSAVASDGTTVANKTYNTNTNYVFTDRKYVINWYKTTENGSTLINGATFKVKNSAGQYITVNNPTTQSDSANAQKACYVYTGANTSGTVMTSGAAGSTSINMTGQVCVSGLPSGTYTVEEIDSAQNHTFGSSKTLSITSGNAFAAMTNSNKLVNYKTEFEFTKTVSSGDTTINGINWNSITTNELKKLSFNITDTNGNLISFVKTSDGVYEYAGNTVDGTSGTAITDLQLDNNRKFKVYHLPKGTYYVKEKKVCCDTSCSSCSGTTPCSGYLYPGYTNTSDYQFTITNCSSPNATSCTSSGKVSKGLNNTPSSITFTKRDIYSYADPTSTVKFESIDEINAFDKIKFRVKDENGNYIKLLKVGNTGTCNTNNGIAEYRYVSDESLLTTEQKNQLTYDINTCGGKIKITHLCRGKKYTIEEVEVPANTVFTLPSTHPSVEYIVPFTDNNKMCCDSTSVTPKTTGVIDDLPTRISLSKKNNRTSEDIHEGTNKKQTATFEVYACEKTVSKCTQATSTGRKIKFGSPRVYGSETVYPALLNQSGNGVTSLNLVTEGTKGKLTLEYLPTNYKYVVVETNAPDGYYNVSGALAETEIDVVPTNTTTANANNKNIIDYPTMIKFRKDDIYKYYSSTDAEALGSSNKIFDSMTFVLRDKDGNIVTLKKTADGEYRFIGGDGTTSGNNVTELHTKNGEMLITNLYRNEKYYIEETKSDTKGNFILPTNISKPSGIPSGWSWKGHPYVIYDLSTVLPNDTNNGTTPSESVTNLIENLPTRVVFEKRDKTTGELIPDSRTTFNVYRCPKTVTSCRATTQGAEIVYFEDRGYIDNFTDDLSSVGPPVLTYKYSKENNSTNKVSDLITDRGVLVLAYLPSEYSYSLYEKDAPNGYYLPSGSEAYTDFTVLSSTLDDGSNYVELTSRIDNKPTEINFIKSDLYDYYQDEDLASIENESLKIFDSMTFVLRDSNGNILSLKCSSDGNFVSNKNSNDRCDTGEYRYIPVDDNNVITEMHTKLGKIKVTHLQRGEVYYIEEVTSDTKQNFVLPDYLNKDLNYGDQLPFDNNGHPVVKYILPLEDAGNPSSITAEIKNIPTRVIFEKRDSKYNYLIPDETTTFKVYQCAIDTECHPSDYSTDEERLAAGITVMNFMDRGVIQGDQEDDGVEVYRYKKLNESGVTELHPNAGKLVLRYLPSDPGYKYVLLETVAPTNYILPIGRDAETEFTIVNNTVEVEEVEVPNKPTALVIRKYADKDGDNEADTDELLGGAKFKVYKVTNYNANRKPQDQDKELIKLKTIKEGIYEYRPVLDTDVITTCSGDNCSYDPNSLGYNSNDFNDLEDLISDDLTSVLKEGTALIEYLEYDTYYVIEEVEAPEGYSLPENDDNRFTLVHIKKNETAIQDTGEALVNKPTSFTFYKFDEYNNPLDGAIFYLQKLDNDKKYNTLSLVKEELSNGNLVYRADENSELTEITTNNGSATVYYLEPGQYRILEVEAPEGYELPKKTINVATFFVDEDGLVYGSNIITNKKPQETIEYLASSKSELIINIQTGKVVVKYGLIITLLVGAIVGLIIFLKKKK
jgi:hypothetical protein